MLANVTSNFCYALSISSRLVLSISASRISILNVVSSSEVKFAWNFEFYEYSSYCFVEKTLHLQVIILIFN